MTESTETAVAVLQVRVASIIGDIERNEKLNDARHSEIMLKLEQQNLLIMAGREFARGVRVTVMAGWAIAGGVVMSAVSWLLWGKP